MIFYYTRQLFKKDNLSIESPFSSLFEFYKPSACWFESLVLVRKAILILVVSTLLNPQHQAIVSLAVHLTYNWAFEYMKPYVFLKTSNGGNLFHLTERSSGIATLIGISMALGGSLNDSNSTQHTVGGIFSIFNVAFMAYVAKAFLGDVRRTFNSAKIAPVKFHSKRHSVNEVRRRLCFFAMGSDECSNFNLLK